MLCSMQQLADAALLADQGDESPSKIIAPVESFLSKMPGAWVRTLQSLQSATAHHLPFWHLSDRQGFEAW